MTIATAVSRNDYTGNGVTISFPYSFRVFLSSDLVVTVKDTLGAETILVLNTDYTVTGAGDEAGGNVVLSAALASGYKLTIRRVRALTQETDVKNEKTFYAVKHEKAFDHMVMLVQQLQEEVGRCFQLPVTEAPSEFTVDLPTSGDRSNKLLGFDADGNLNLINMSSVGGGGSSTTTNVSEYPGANLGEKIQAAHDAVNGGVLDARSIVTNRTIDGLTLSKPVHILFPHGDITVTDTILIERPDAVFPASAGADGLMLEGVSNRGTRFLAPGSVKPVFDLDTCFDVYFKNFWAEHTSADPDAIMIKCHWGDDAGNPWVLRPYFENVTLKGYNYNGWGISFSRCYVSSGMNLHIWNFDHGVHNVDDGFPFYSNANYFGHSRIYDNTVGVYYAGVGANWLHDCIIEGNKQYGVYSAGIGMLGITNCYFEQVPASGADANVFIEGADDTFSRTFNFTSCFFAGFNGLVLAEQKKDIIIGAGAGHHVWVRGGVLNSGVSVGAGQPAPIIDCPQFGANEGTAISTYTTDTAWVWDGGNKLFIEQAVTNITQANPGVLTYSGADSFENGDQLYLYDLTGMDELDDTVIIVANVNTGANTFELHDEDDNPIDTTGFVAYSSGGILRKQYFDDPTLVIQIQNWIRMDVVDVKLNLLFRSSETASTGVTSMDAGTFANPGANSDAFFAGARFLAQVDDGNQFDFTNGLSAKTSRGAHYGDGDVFSMSGDIVVIENHGTGEMSNGIGTIYKTPVNDGGGTMPNYYHILMEDPGSGKYALYANGGTVILNASKTSYGDLLVLGDTDDSLLLCDASLDRVAIGKFLPAEKLDVAGAIQLLLGTGTQTELAIGKAYVNTTAVGNVGAGEDDLMSTTLAANSLSAAAKGIRITVFGTTANNANAKTLKLYFGTTAIVTVTLTASIAGVWKVVAEVFSTGTDAQDYFVNVSTTGAAGVALNQLATGNTTADDGATIAVKCTGEATADNDIVQEFMLIEGMN